MNSLFTRISLFIAFISVSFGVNAQTISSTLNGRPGVLVGVEEDFQTIYSGVTASSVVLKITLEDPTQAADIDLSVLALGSYTSLTIGTDGVAESPAVPTFLFSSPLDLKVTFAAAGVYDYSIAIIDNGTSLPIATSIESVTVGLPPALTLPIISSTIGGDTVLTDATTQFEISTVANDYAGTQTLVYFEALNSALVPHVTIETLVGITWIPIDISSGSSTFPPFSLVDGSETFRVTFDTVGTYPFKLSLVDVSTEDTLASSVETVVVEDPIPVAATVSSDLDARTGVVINIEEAFTITTVANDFADEDVRIKITLETPAQAPNFFITYNSTTVTFDANGVAYIGAVAGFPLDDEDFDLEATFLAGGTFAYNIAVVDVADNSVLAESDEEVFVLDNSSIADNASFISNTFPNPTEGIVNIQTTETGAGTLGVYTLTGKKVINRNINGPVNTVSLETLPAGMYIIKISQNEKDAVIRVVKK